MITRIIGEYCVLCDYCGDIITDLRTFRSSAMFKEVNHKNIKCHECKAKKKNIQKTKKK